MPLHFQKLAHTVRIELIMEKRIYIDTFANAQPLSFILKQKVSAAAINTEYSANFGLQKFLKYPILILKFCGLFPYSFDSKKLFITQKISKWLVFWTVLANLFFFLALPAVLYGAFSQLGDLKMQSPDVVVWIIQGQLSIFIVVCFYLDSVAKWKKTQQFWNTMQAFLYSVIHDPEEETKARSLKSYTTRICLVMGLCHIAYNLLYVIIIGSTLTETGIPVWIAGLLCFWNLICTSTYWVQVLLILFLRFFVHFFDIIERCFKKASTNVKISNSNEFEATMKMYRECIELIREFSEVFAFKLSIATLLSAYSIFIGFRTSIVLLTFENHTAAVSTEQLYDLLLCLPIYVCSLFVFLVYCDLGSKIVEKVQQNLQSCS